MKDESQQQVPPDQDMTWFGNRTGTMYFIERENYKYGGKWRCLGEGLNRSDIPSDENINWTNNPEAALAWKSKEGAELWNKKYFIGGFVTEHEFVDGKSKLPPPSQPGKPIKDFGEGFQGGDSYTNYSPHPSQPVQGKELFEKWLLKNAWRRLDDDNYAHEYKTWGGFPVYKKTKDLFAEYLESQPHEQGKEEEETNKFNLARELELCIPDLNNYREWHILKHAAYFPPKTPLKLEALAEENMKLKAELAAIKLSKPDPSEEEMEEAELHYEKGWPDMIENDKYYFYEGFRSCWEWLSTYKQTKP